MTALATNRPERIRLSFVPGFYLPLCDEFTLALGAAQFCHGAICIQNIPIPNNSRTKVRI